MPAKLVAQNDDGSFVAQTDGGNQVVVAPSVVMSDPQLAAQAALLKTPDQAPANEDRETPVAGVPTADAGSYGGAGGSTPQPMPASPMGQLLKGLFVDPKAPNPQPLPPGQIGSNADGSPMMASNQSGQPGQPNQMVPAPIPTAQPSQPQQANLPQLPSIGAGGTSNLERLNQQGYDRVKAGIDQQVATQSDLGTKTQTILNSGLTDQDKRQKLLDARNLDLQSKTNGYMTQLQSMADDIAHSNVDPNHYWASTDTGNKILAAVSIALGGLGQGMSHGSSNVALDIIQKNIDRDIAAQKDNIQNKRASFETQKGLLSTYLQAGLSMNEAEAAAKKSAWDIVDGHVKALTAGNQGALASAQGQQLLGQLQMKQADANSTLRTQAVDRATKAQGAEIQRIMLQAQLGQMNGQAALDQKLASGQPLSDTEIQGLPADKRKLIARAGPNQNFAAIDEKSAQDINETGARRGSLMNAIGTIERLQGTHPNGALFGSDAQAAKDAASVISRELPLYFAGTARQNDKEVEGFKDMAEKDPLGLINMNTGLGPARLKNLKGMIDGELQGKLTQSAFGFKPPPPAAP